MEMSATKKGFSIVEVMLAVGIFAIFSVGIFYLSAETITRGANVNLGTEALYYAQEGIEAVRSIRDRNFLFLVSGDYGLDYQEGEWDFVSAPEDIDGFYERTITIEDVYRDELGNIKACDYEYDPDMKKVLVSVTWTQGGVVPRSVGLEAYLANWRGDDTLDTTCADFNQGVYSGIETLVAVEPPVDNCEIRISPVETPSNFMVSVGIGKHSDDVEVRGNYAFVAVDDSDKGLYSIDVSNKEHPAIADYLDIGGKGRYLEVDGDYIYLGTDDYHDELVVVNASNPENLSKITSRRLDSWGTQPRVLGDYLYMGADTHDEALSVFDISSRDNPQFVDEFEFEERVYGIGFYGNYLFLALCGHHKGFIVMDNTDPHNMFEITSFDTNQKAKALIVKYPVVYLGIDNDNGSLKVVDISDPTDPEIIKTVDVGDEIRDLTILGNYLYAAVDETHAGLAALNISDPFNPYLAYTLDVGGKGSGIDSDEEYIYVTTSTGNKGLIIVGATQEGVGTSGDYVSRAFDTGSDYTVFNFIEWEGSGVPGSEVRFQIRTANSTGNLGNATWVGADGTNSTYYEASRSIITLDPGMSGSRYFQYKIFFESDGISTPTVDSVRINYSP